MHLTESANYHKDRSMKIAQAEYFLGELDPQKETLIAFTLTLRHRSAQGEPCDRIPASQNFRDFMNRLERKTIGNLGRRYPHKKIKVYPVLETKPNLHYHGVMVPPATFKDKLIDFLYLIPSTWSETAFGYNQTDVQFIYSENWMSYISKFRNSADEPDYSNLNWFDRSQSPQ